MRYTFSQRLQSVRHALSFAISRRLPGARREKREAPAGTLTGLNDDEATGIAALRARYHCDFAVSLNARSARNNYAYLAALDSAFAELKQLPPRDARLVDVGSANFWYAAALQAFFRPRQLTGVEFDGYRRLQDGHTRHDAALGHVATLPGAAYLVADYTTLRQPAEVITAWFPFVTAAPLLAWRLPLSTLQPAALFASVRRNLQPNGCFVMINRMAEAEAAGRYAASAGLRQLGASVLTLELVEGPQAITVSIWRAN